jgi:predicted DNA-binding antitoxin AbrB/MazE fold protein
VGSWGECQRLAEIINFGTARPELSDTSKVSLRLAPCLADDGVAHTISRSHFMDLHFDAIFENGVLRPIGPVDLPERARLTVTVELPKQNGDGLSKCIGTLSPEAADEMMSIIEREFEQVDPRDW